MPQAFQQPGCFPEGHGNRGRCLVVMYGFALNDPPTTQAAASLAQRGYKVTLIQCEAGGQDVPADIPGLTTQTVKTPDHFKQFRPLHAWLKWCNFKQEVALTLTAVQPELVITIMLGALAALPKTNKRKFELVSCIYDIPPLGFAGKMDKLIFATGWKRLREAQAVWSSDSCKAALAQEAGSLIKQPDICHNCPTLDYLPEPALQRNGWLRQELRNAGASLGERGGSILLRAGAVGESCGIEETLHAMQNLPEDYIFLMMGRPSAEYREFLLARITKLNLKNRAILWNRPDNETWKKALLGADIGHLIHGPFPPGYLSRLYELNSSLSNNRLFQYMAAGLPILCYDDQRMNAIYKEVPCFSVARLEHLQADVGSIWKQLGPDLERRNVMGRAGRKAHLTKYHWEKQFSPVLEAITTISSNQYNSAACT